MSANAFEVAARAKKVLLLCQFFPVPETIEERDRTVAWVLSLSMAQWQILANGMGCAFPSETTRKQVVNVLRARQPMSHWTRGAVSQSSSQPINEIR